MASGFDKTPQYSREDFADNVEFLYRECGIRQRLRHAPKFRRRPRLGDRLCSIGFKK